MKLALEDTDGEERIVEARICWQIQSDDGSIAGCQFTSNEAYADVCACLTEKPISPAQPRVDGERTSNLVLAVAVLAMFVPPMMTLFMQANKVSAGGSATTIERSVDAECDDDYLSAELDRPEDAAPVEILPDKELISELAKEIQALTIDSEPEPVIEEPINRRARRAARRNGKLLPRVGRQHWQVPHDRPAH